MLLPTCAMPDCDHDAVPSDRFCAECGTLADGPKSQAQAQAQHQAVPVEVAAETLSERQSEAVELLTRRPDLSRSVRELLDRVSVRLELEPDAPPLLTLHTRDMGDMGDMRPGGVNDPDTALEAILLVADAVGFTEIVQAYDEGQEWETSDDPPVETP